MTSSAHHISIKKMGGWRSSIMRCQDLHIKIMLRTNNISVLYLLIIFQFQFGTLSKKLNYVNIYHYTCKLYCGRSTIYGINIPIAVMGTVAQCNLTHHVMSARSTHRFRWFCSCFSLANASRRYLPLPRKRALDSALSCLLSLGIERFYPYCSGLLLDWWAIMRLPQWNTPQELGQMYHIDSQTHNNMNKTELYFTKRCSIFTDIN